MDPSFSAHAFSTRWRARFYLKNDFYCLEKWLGVATYFCFIFWRVNKIKKKNLKYDSLFWKRWFTKNRIGFRGQVTYREGTIKVQLMSKSMNILNDHAHIRIITCTENDQDASRYVLGQQATIHYQERGLVHN